MVNYDEVDGTYPTDIHTKTNLVTFTFDRTNIRFYFSQLEMLMETAGVQSQWQKRLLLQRNLPPDVIADLENI